MLTKPTIKRLTKDEITRSAIMELKAYGARVRKVHNVAAYKKRRGQVEPGWPDIQGYSKGGKIVLCEVKTYSDRLSQEQMDLLEDCNNCGGISLIACDDKSGNFHLIYFTEYLNL